MQTDTKKLESTLQKTKIFLITWFTILTVTETVLMIIGNVAAILLVFLNVGYIVAVICKDTTAKVVVFWIHTILAGIGGLLLISFLVYYCRDTSMLSIPRKSNFIQAVLTTALFYLFFTILSIIVFWNHCVTAKRLKTLKKGISSNEEGRSSIQDELQMQAEIAYGQEK